MTVHGHDRFEDDEVLIGMPLRDILRRRTPDPAAIDDMVEAFRDHYVDEAWRAVQAYPGVLEAVQALRDDGLRTAVVTTKGEAEAEAVLRNLGLRGLFDTVVGDDDVRPVKPDPAPVIAACGRLGRRPIDAAMVGDTSFDIDAGRAAGAYTVGVRWGTGWSWGAAPDGADAVVQDADELLGALRAWASGGSADAGGGGGKA